MGGVRWRSRVPGPSHRRPRYLDLLTKYIERLLHLNGLSFLQHYDPYVRQSKQRIAGYCTAPLVSMASSSTVATVSLPLAANQRTAGSARPMGVHMLYLTVASTDFTTNAWRLCWQPEPHFCRGQFPISEGTRRPLHPHASPEPGSEDEAP